MGWDGSGNIIRTNGTNTGGTVWQDDADADVKIRADRHDTHDQDLADSIEQALNRNGENTPSTNIGWGAHKITNLGDGASADDAATVGQVQSQIAGVAQASGTDALTATFSPAITAFTDKTTIYVRAAAANTSATPTFAPNGLAAKTITKEGNQALVAGDIAGAAHVIALQYSASNDVWELLNPVNPPTKTLTGGGSFPNVDADVTATDEELNKLDGFTGTTADMNAVLTPYATATVELGGDFSAGESVKCERIGDTVTISGVGVLSHSSTFNPSSSAGVVPATFRPSAETANCYSYKSGLSASIYIQADGTITFQYYKPSNSESTSARTDTTYPPSITFGV